MKSIMINKAAYEAPSIDIFQIVPEAGIANSALEFPAEDFGELEEF